MHAASLRRIGLLTALAVASMAACDLCAVSSTLEASRADADPSASHDPHQPDAPGTAATAPASGPLPSHAMPHASRGWSIGLLGTYQDADVATDGGRRADAAVQQGLYHQYLTTTTVELMAQYRVADRWAVRVYIPVTDIRYRTYAVIGNGQTGVEEGRVDGLADSTVEATWLMRRSVTAHHMDLTTAIVGVTLPTGDSSQLDNEEAIADGQNPNGHVHTGSGPVSLVHPHDLALGSGSVDGVLGLAEYARWDRCYGTARALFLIRTPGRAGYQYANQLSWGGGPGVYLLMGRQGTLGLQANITGDMAGPDHVHGRRVDNSGSTDLYLGPEVTGTWSAGLSAEAGVDIPLLLLTEGQQLTPHYRAHAGVSWMF